MCSLRPAIQLSCVRRPLSILCKSISENMSSLLNVKHLTVGDAFPAEVNDGDKIVLLTMRFCPYAQRAHLVLDAKRIPHHIVNIHLKQKPEWLTEYSRLGKVPAIGLVNEPGKPYIHESLIIADYLDDKYNDVRPLYPADPLAKVQDRLWLERFNNGIVASFFAIVMHGQKKVDELSVQVDEFEAELKRRGQRFFSSPDAPGMLDYMIWPFVERLELMQHLDGDKFFLTAERYPLLVQYFADMLQDEAVKKTFLSGEIHHKFMLGHSQGKPEYELLHKQN